MNPNMGGMSKLLGGTAPKLNLQKLHDAYKSIQELRMFASPSIQQLLDQIPNPLHPEYTDPEEEATQGMGQMSNQMSQGGTSGY